MLYDLHVHTCYSDGRINVSEALEAAKAKHIGLAIADHNEIRGSLAGYSLAQNIKAPFLCGLELGTREGKELLFYFKKPENLERFYLTEVESYKTARMTRLSRSMESFLDEEIKRKYDVSLVVLPHPFGLWFKNINWNRDLSSRMINYCDALEVINGQMSQTQNYRALCAAIRFNKHMSAGSDAHLLSHIGEGLTTLTEEDGKLIPDTFISHTTRATLGTIYQILHSNIKYTCLEHYQSCVSALRIRRKVRRRVALRRVRI